MGGDFQRGLVITQDNHVLNTHFRHLFDHPACMQEKPMSTAVGFLAATLPDRWQPRHATAGATDGPWRQSESLPALPIAQRGPRPAVVRGRARSRTEGARSVGRRALESPGAAARAAAAEPRRLEVQLPQFRPAVGDYELRPRSVARSPRCQAEAWHSRSVSNCRREEAAPLQRGAARLYEPPPVRRPEPQQAVARAALRRTARAPSPCGKRATWRRASARCESPVAGSKTPLADLVLRSAGLPPSRRQLM